MEKELEENKQKNSRYGFFANVREEPSGVIVRINWLENLIKTSYSITAKRGLIGATAILLPSVLAIFFLTGNGTRAKFLFLSILILIIALIFFVGLYVFIDPASGSLLSGSTRMFSFLIDYCKVKLGKKPKARETGVEMVLEDGTIIFKNEDYGVMFFLDGKTSATAYPEEVIAQEKLCIKYQNARNRTTSEIKITSSQKQKADKQRMNFAKEMSVNRNNKAIRDIVALQDLFVERAVEGKRTQIIQYLIVREPSRTELDKHIGRLETYNNRGMYYSLIACDKKETDKILTDIFWLK